MRSDRMPHGAWRLRMVEDKLERWIHALERGMKVNRRKTECMCVRACVRACVRVCVCACEREAESKSE